MLQHEWTETKGTCPLCGKEYGGVAALKLQHGISEGFELVVCASCAADLEPAIKAKLEELLKEATAYEVLLGENLPGKDLLGPGLLAKLAR